MEIKQAAYAVNGITLHVLEKGEDRKGVIIFLHGFPEMAAAWLAQIEYFSEKGYKVVAPDQRGYNKSSKPAGVKAYKTEILVADIVALIRRLTTGKVIMVGHDWGGAVAWQLAMLHPQLVKRLIIINMPHPKVMLATLKKSSRQKRKSIYIGFFQLPLLPEKFCKAFDFYLLKRTLTTSSIKGTFSNDLLIQYQNGWRQKGAMTAMLNWYRAYRHSKLSSGGSIEVPTLLIWGKNDRFLNHEMAGESIEQCINGKLVMDEQCTHWIHHEKPHFVNASIELFIEATI